MNDSQTTSTRSTPIPTISSTAPSTPSTSTPPISTSDDGGSTSGTDLISRLPPVVWGTLIGSWLGIPDIMTISSTSKYLRRIFRGSSSWVMWRLRIMREYPGIPACPPSVVEPCLITRIENSVCLTYSTLMDRELVPYLIGRWCLACKDKEFIDNSTIKVEEVRMILPRTKMTARACVEYSLSQDAKEGEKLYCARFDSELNGVKWKEWKEEGRSLRKFGDRFAVYFARRQAKIKTLATLPDPTPAPAPADCTSAAALTGQLGVLSRLGRVKGLRKPSFKVQYYMDKEGKKPVPACGVPAGTYVYKFNLDLVQGKQKPLGVSVLAPPELLGD